MKQLEIATTLLEAAKETKQHLVTAASNMDFEEYQDIFNSLCKIYFSLGLPDTLLPYMDAVQKIQVITDEYKIVYIKALNHIITETILYRGQYCIIRRTDPVPGLASHIMTNLGQIVAALNEGYIPVIDMQFADNLFSTLNKNHMVNAWELFFKQPFEGHTLASASKAEVCILKDGIPGFMPYYNMEQLTNPAFMQLWKDAMRRYMPFSDTVQTTAKAICQEFPFEEKKILGVLCRGTDYMTLRPHNHPVQPSTDVVIKKAKDIMQEFQCDYCYLATEDESILSAFRNAFGDHLLVSQSIYFKKEQKMLLSKTMTEEPVQLYEKNIEYLISLYLLSRCHCFLSGRTSGAVVALMLNETPYAYTHFWNEGKYGVDDLQTLQNLTIASIIDF